MLELSRLLLCGTLLRSGNRLPGVGGEVHDLAGSIPHRLPRSAVCCRAPRTCCAAPSADQRATPSAKQ
jgi:hypothetical protein